MRIGIPHAPYIANKIAIDLNRSELVSMTRGLELVSEIAKKYLIEDIKKEVSLEERANEIIDDNEDQIEFYLADEKQLFWMLKKKLADEYEVVMNFEDRYSKLSHQILDELYEEDLLQYKVPENRIKNIIYDAIDGYVKARYDVEDAVHEQMSHYKRKLIPGSDEYEILYTKLYEDELVKRGMA